LNIDLQDFNTRLAALNQRERWLVFLASLAVVYVVLNTLVLAPVSNKQRLLATELTQAKTQFEDVQQKITSFKQNPVLDIDTVNQQKISALNAKLQSQSEQLAALQSGLVSPAHMPALLKSLMRNGTNMRLVDMKTLEPENVLLKKTSTQNDGVAVVATTLTTDGQATIYKHGLEITISGHYLDLLEYADALQTLSNQVLWEKAVLTTKAHPVSELTVTIYTLSLDKTWLSI
jgi:MSHA biogenesis protein MshJ